MKGNLVIGIPEPDRCYVHVYEGPDTESKPLFSMLLPEFVADSSGEIIPPERLPVDSWLHMQPTRWEDLGDGSWSALQSFPGYLTSGTVISPVEEGLELKWTLTNESDRCFQQPYGNFCLGSGWAGTGFQPPEGWFNPDFQEVQTSMKVDASEGQQELYRKFVDNWRNNLMPKNVWIHDGDRWEKYASARHSALPMRSWEMEATECRVRVIAMESLDGGRVLAQGWGAPGRACIGPHLCIHLCPVVAERLEPGEKATVKGRANLLEGNRETALERHREHLG